MEVGRAFQTLTFLATPMGPELRDIATQPSPQFGLLGEALGRKVALDLNQTHTISLFGVQGGATRLGASSRW